MRISDWSSDVCSSDLPGGLRESDELPDPVFTPSTKSDVHDENISFERAVELVGEDLATRARDVSLQLYKRGAAMARDRGIINAEIGRASGRGRGGPYGYVSVVAG